MTDFLPILNEQRDWSSRTFGPGFRPKGIVDHIRKECDEIEEDPYDLEEWVDILILGFDGAMRAGYGPEEIFWAYVAKTAKNKARKWPDYKTADLDKAIEHIRDDE